MCPDDCRGCKKSHTVILCIIPILLTLSLSLSNIQYSLNPGVTLSSFRSNIVWPQYPIILGVVRTWPHFLPLIINHSFKHCALLRGEYHLSKLIAQSSENTINSYLQAVTHVTWLLQQLHFLMSTFEDKKVKTVSYHGTWRIEDCNLQLQRQDEMLGMRWGPAASCSWSPPCWWPGPRTAARAASSSPAPASARGTRPRAAARTSRGS